MSVNANVYIGWYIKGKTRYQKSNDSEYVCSGDIEHDVDAHSNFCGWCGSQIVQQASLKPRALNIYDVPESKGDLEDRFYEPEYVAKQGEVILVSNWSAGNYNKNFDNGEIVNLDRDEQTKQYTAFIKEHADDVKLLQEYVYDDVQLLYGAFLYYS